MLKLSNPQFEALAMLYQGPAERTNGRTGNGRANRQAVLALMRQCLAVAIDRRTFDITIAGRLAYEEAMQQ